MSKYDGTRLMLDEVYTAVDRLWSADLPDGSMFFDVIDRIERAVDDAYGYLDGDEDAAEFVAEVPDHRSAMGR